MSLYLYEKYISLISNRLENFVSRDGQYQFRCPFCGDSTKNKYKSRGYLFMNREKNGYIYKCHNCGEPHSLFTLIKHIDEALAKAFNYDLFMEKNGRGDKRIEPVIVLNKPKKYSDIDLPRIYDLEDGHIAKDYIIDRKIPITLLKELYYTDCFFNFVDEFYKDEYPWKNLSGPVLDMLAKPRIIIPFIDKNNKVFAIQGRCLDNEGVRYITIKVDEQHNKVFGLNKIKFNRNIYVVEGAIDSLFIPNCIASCDSNLTSVVKEVNKEKLILIYDNEPRNIQIVKLIGRAIDEGFRVVLFPNDFKYKDINESIIGCVDIMKMIKENTHVGIMAKLKFNQWKRC